VDTKIWRWSAIDLAKAIREKQISCREAVQAHLDRIESVNERVNAITAVLAKDALDMAAKADKAVTAGDKLGPLHGVPFTVKENIDLIGSATTEGVPAFAEALPPVDAPHIANMKKAGAIPIARTNLPEFGLRWHTDNALHGATRNPWDASRTPGGSSAGEAVALATGMTPLGMGNDYGGSLRWPSQCAGTTAIRPTLGRVPFASSLAPAEPMFTVQLFGVQGPMARHVKDLRVALAAMSERDSRDPWWVPAPLPGPPVPGPVKVAVTKNPGGLGVDPSVAAGVGKAAQALADAGYEVQEVDVPLVAEANQMWARLATTEINTLIMALIQPIISQDAVSFLNLVTEMYPTLDIAGYAFALADRNRIAREWSLFLAKYPIVVGPVATSPPFAVGADLSKDTLSEFVMSLRLVTTVSLLGLPSAVVPVGMINGLPQSVQIITTRYREDICLDAGEAIEQRVEPFTPIDPK
jgi:amidase